MFNLIKLLSLYKKTHTINKIIVRIICIISTINQEH